MDLGGFILSITLAAFIGFLGYLKGYEDGCGKRR